MPKAAGCDSWCAVFPGGGILWPYAGTGAERVQTLLNRGEVAGDERAICRAAKSLAPTELDSGQLTSQYLNYHLRTLLHRNDCLGMEASVEARFPVPRPCGRAHGDQHAFTVQAARFADRLREGAPVRQGQMGSPRSREPVDSPQSYAQRIKIGFWTTVFQRTDVPARYFDDSFVRRSFELSAVDMREVVEEAIRICRCGCCTSTLAHVCLEGRDIAESRAKIMRYVTIRPE